MSDLDHAIELISEQIRNTCGLITCINKHFLILSEAYLTEGAFNTTYYEAPARCLETLEDAYVNWDILPQFVDETGRYNLPANEENACDWNNPVDISIGEKTYPLW